MKPLTEPPPRYAEWLDHCFRCPQRSEVIADPGNEGPRKDSIELTDEELVALFEVTMRRAGTDLAPVPDEVIGDGLALILDGSRSDFSRRIRSASVAVERKANAVRAIKALYDDVLTPRAQPRLGHLGETGDHRLSAICYRLWDVTKLAHWAPRDEHEAVPQAILEVLEHALTSPNDAVVESGLLGLARLASPSRADSAVERLLAARPDLRPELRRYAEVCAAGNMP